MLTQLDKNTAGHWYCGEKILRHFVFLIRGYFHRREEARTEPSTSTSCHFRTVTIHLETLKNMETRKK